MDAPIHMYNAIRCYVQKVSTQHVVTKAFIYYILGLDRIWAYKLKQTTPETLFHHSWLIFLCLFSSLFHNAEFHKYILDSVYTEMAGGLKILRASSNVAVKLVH